MSIMRGAHWIAALALVLAAGVAGAEERERIGVVDFEMTQKIMTADHELGQSVADLMLAQLEKRYEVVRRTDLAAAAEKTRTRTSTLFARPDAAVTIARAAGLKWLVCGKIYSFGDRVVIHAKLLDVGEEKFSASTWGACDGIDAIPEALPRVLRNLGLSEPARAAPLAKPRAAAAARKSTEALIKELLAPDAGVRFSAAVELGHAGDEKAIEPLIRVLAGDSDLFVRRAAARALGEIGEVAAVPALIKALQDKDYFVAITAEKALEAITGQTFDLRDGMSPGEVERVAAEATVWWEANRPR